MDYFHLNKELIYHLESLEKLDIYGDIIRDEIKMCLQNDSISFISKESIKVILNCSVCNKNSVEYVIKFWSAYKNQPPTKRPSI